LINNNWDSLLQSDRTYMFKLQGTYFLPYGFSASANFIAQTGKPIARLITVRGMNQGSFPVMGEPRGTQFRLDPYYVLDFRLDKKFNLPGGGAVSISADFFNMLNTDALTGTVDIGTSALFMKPDTITPPRRIQLSLRLIF
ncbi:MAG: hypothetical protein JXB23_00985, partial [Candidatus Aminicenantes bacterium]|nr:hypothetical protein [Candidatus Aminicenantes bacterium]